MVETLQTPFHRSLAAQRSRLNTRFATARHAHPTLEPAVVLDYLGATIGPIVEAVAAVQPAAADPTLDALFDLSLELIQEGVLGPAARQPVLNEAWRTLLPALPAHLAAEPRRVAGSLTNALYNLASMAAMRQAVRPAAWLAAMRTLGPDCPDVATLLKAGQVAAWLAGMAHYRSAALALCRELEPALAMRVLGIDEAGGPERLEMQGMSSILDRLAADPWLLPQSAALARPAWTPALKLAARAGAFRGFGGVFLAPPTVSWTAGQFYVQDGDAWWLLNADVFGATLLRGDAPAKPSGHAAGSPFQVSRAAEITCGPHRAAFPELTAVQSWAADEKTLAVTSPLSHAVYLFAVM
jgi:hypothetical protein